MEPATSTPAPKPGLLARLRGGAVAQGLVTAIRKIPLPEVLFIGFGILLAIALRLSLLEFKSVDFFHYTKGWFNTIKDQGFSAFRFGFYNYNPPYLYLLYVIIRFFPDLPAVAVTKLPSMISDFICAVFVYKIVRLKFAAGPLPVFAGFAVLFAPTVILNSAAWGQADSLYTTALVACLYYLIKRENVLALLAFAIALAFKLQAIFLFPFLIAWFFKKEVSWKPFLLVPLVLALALLPAWIAGRPLIELSSIYLSQANQYGNNAELTLNAPTFYNWLPQSHALYDILIPAGILLAASVAFLFIFLVFESDSKLSPASVLELSLAILLLMPFFLPKMHDRYFYPADVVSILFAFYFPRYFFIPLATSLISFFAYQPFLFGQDLVPMPFLALAMFFVICLVLRKVIGDLFPHVNQVTEPGKPDPT